MYYLTYTSNANPVFRRNYELNKRLIAAAAELCTDRGIDFVLVGISVIYTPEDERNYRAEDPTFDPDCFDTDLGAFADAGGFEYVGLRPVFKQWYNDREAPLFWSHWNYAGHRVVADALDAALSPGTRPK